MKPKLPLMIVCLLFSILSQSQTLFYDDFEPEDGALFNNLTNENLADSHYDAFACEGNYHLPNNLKVKTYASLTSFEFVGSSEHFEFYTSLSGETEYWLELQEKLEVAYLKYKSIWERPSSNTVFPIGGKIKIKYCSRVDIPHFNTNTPAWDCGSYDFQTGEIYVTNLISIEQKEYYGDIVSIAVNELAQMALEGWLDWKSEAWYSEGFGLFEMGYRPVREQLLQKLSKIGTENPEIDQIVDISQLNEAGNKDLMASLFESKALVHCNFYGHWGNSLYKWWQLLKHYYIKNVDRIELLFSTEHFDFWAAVKEKPYIESMAANMEEQLSVQESRFNKTMDHRVSVCIYDNKVGLEINNRTDFQGLANPPDNINTSHLEIGDYGLVNHEFMHIWVNMLSPFSFDFIQFPGQFINEGLAESTDGFMTDEEIPWHNYKIEGLYYHYQRKYNREPTWLEIVDNAEVNKEDGFWVDAYALGEMYWRYMNDKYPTNFWMKVKEFLQNGRDWSVFGGKTTEQEGADFIYYLKSLVNYIPPDTILAIPLKENFQDFSNGWTKPSYNNPDNWQIDDGGLNGGNCARFYSYSDKNIPIESWLISPPFDLKNKKNVNISFDFARFGNEIGLELYYTNSFNGDIEDSNWSLIKKIDMPTDWGWSNSGILTLTDLPDTLFIGIVKKSNGAQHLQLYIDNFSISEQQVVETRSSTDVNHNSAILNGLLVDDFNATASQRGFYWSLTNPDPDETDSVAIVAGNSPDFSFDLEGLIPESIYYFKAFGKDETGTKTGDVKQFKTLAAPILAELPFSDDFSKDYKNWSTTSVVGADQWHISGDDGIGGSRCARFYITSNPQQSNDDWLVSQIFNSKGLSKVIVEFKYWYHDNGFLPEFYYSNSFDGNLGNSDWKQLDNSFWKNEWTWNTANIEIENPGEKLVFAIRYQSNASKSNYILIDNLSLKGITTNSDIWSTSDQEFKIYPNPITSESIISFTTKTNDKVNLTVYDLQGRKICTLIDNNLAAGNHTIQLENQIQTNGVYLCKLVTTEGISTKKLILTNNNTD